MDICVSVGWPVVQDEFFSAGAGLPNLFIQIHVGPFSQARGLGLRQIYRLFQFKWRRFSWHSSSILKSEIVTGRMVVHQKRIYLECAAKGACVWSTAFRRYSQLFECPPKDGTPNNQKPEPFSLLRRWSGLSKPWMFRASADKHLLVCIARINRRGRGRNQHFQSASHTGENRRQFARRLNHFCLDEFSRRRNPFMGRVDGPTDYLDLFPRHVCSLIREHGQSPHFFLDQCRRFRQMTRRRRYMTGHDIELLGNLTPLDRDGLTVF